MSNSPLLFFWSVHPQLSSVLTDAIRPGLLGSSIHLVLVVWKPVCLIMLLGRVNQNNWGILSIWVKSPCWALCCCSWISSAWKAFSTLIQASEIATDSHRTCKAVTPTCLLPNDRDSLFYSSVKHSADASLISTHAACHGFLTNNFNPSNCPHHF